jgi:hypothetical protein
MENRTGTTGIGIEGLPGNIRYSKILTAGNIALLAGAGEIPVIDPAYNDERLKNIFQYYSINPEEMEKELQLYANELLDMGKVKEAWQVLLSIG